MQFTVYIVYSEKCDRFYTGQTQDVANRLFEHNNRETSSIKNCSPWRLVWTVGFPSRSDAMRFEKKVKSRGALRFLQSQGVNWR